MNDSTAMQTAGPTPPPNVNVFLEDSGEEDPPGLELADKPALWGAAVIGALKIGMAPVVNHATEILRDLHNAARDPLEEGTDAMGWIEALVAKELAGLRARALWPHPVGTPVICVNGGKSFPSRTTSIARAQPDGSILVSVEGLVGAARVQDLSVSS